MFKAVSGGVLPQQSQIAGTQIDSFQIEIYPVTFAEWIEVRNWAIGNGFDLRAGREGGQSPLPWSSKAADGKSAGLNLPVTEISWFDALKWCNAKSLINCLEPVYILKEEKTHFCSGVYESEDSFHFIEFCSNANGYRLPTDAEWEWAAMGGCDSQGFTYAGSNDLNQAGWYEGNSGGEVHEVGLKLSNELGLFDMSGNVHEWVWDEPKLSNSPSANFRGGSWNCYAAECEVIGRNFGNPNYAATTMGLRVARNA